MRNRTGLPRLTVAAISILVLALAGSAGAQNIPKGKEIHIHLAAGGTRISKVLPGSKGVCRGNHDEDCDDEVAWVLKGSRLPTGWYVELNIKSGATKKCFAKAPFELRDGNPVPSGPLDAKVCERWDVWPYDVVLRDEKGAEKDRIDPLIVVNR